MTPEFQLIMLAVLSVSAVLILLGNRRYERGLTMHGIEMHYEATEIPNFLDTKKSVYRITLKYNHRHSSFIYQGKRPTIQEFLQTLMKDESPTDKVDFSVHEQWYKLREFLGDEKYNEIKLRLFAFP